MKTILTSLLLLSVVLFVPSGLVSSASNALATSVTVSPQQTTFSYGILQTETSAMATITSTSYKTRPIVTSITNLYPSSTTTQTTTATFIFPTERVATTTTLFTTETTLLSSTTNTTTSTTTYTSSSTTEVTLTRSSQEGTYTSSTTAYFTGDTTRISIQSISFSSTTLLGVQFKTQVNFVTEFVDFLVYVFELVVNFTYTLIRYIETIFVHPIVQRVVKVTVERP